MVVLPSSVVGAVLVVAQTSPEPGAVAWATGAGAASAVAGLVYVARQMVNGRLVARDSADAEKRLAGLVDRNADLAARFERLAEEAHRREERMWETRHER